MISENDLRNLSHANLKRVTSICERLHRIDPGTSFIQHSRDTLHNAFGNIHFSADIYPLDHIPFQKLEMHILNQNCWIPLLNEHVLKKLQDHQTGCMQSAPDLGRTDPTSAPDPFTESSSYKKLLARIEAPNPIWIGLRDGNELLDCIYSRKRAYSSTQLAMIAMIQPHLATAWKNWKQVQRLQQKLDSLKKTLLLTTEDEKAAAVLARRIFDALTPKQRAVSELVGAGMDNQQIADSLNISVWTVKKHLQAIFQCLQIRHRTELASKWHQANSISIK